MEGRQAIPFEPEGGIDPAPRPPLADCRGTLPLRSGTPQTPILSPILLAQGGRMVSPEGRPS